MTEELSFKPAAGLDRIGNECCERVQDENIAINDAMILPYHVNPDRMGFSEGTADYETVTTSTQHWWIV